jgi:aminoglycoside phosphotransferase (APT) family kinase protein
VRKPDIDPSIVRAIVNRLFSDERHIPFERTSSGQSTQVYRLHSDHQQFFLRFGEDPNDTFAPEAWVHDRLETLGARVPHVVHVEDVANEIDRSIMLTTSIPGEALERDEPRHKLDDGRWANVFRVAGRDLAQVNSISVDGFGFVQRERPWSGTLTAPRSTFDAWVLSTMGDCATLEQHFTGYELLALDEHRERVSLEQVMRHASLAHGDFDTSHIFASDDRYAGVIDFGEMRGADRWYDLADFLLRSGGRWESPSVTSVVRGYAEIYSLGRDDLEQIRSRAITLGPVWLQRLVGRNLPGFETMLVRSVRALLASGVPLGLIG